MQTAAGLTSQEDILVSQGEKQAAAGYAAEASADRTAATGSNISAIIKGVAGIAEFMAGGGPMAAISDVAIAAGGAPENWNTSLPSGSLTGLYYSGGGMGLPEGAAGRTTLGL
jgi:hypothetical protein